MMNRIGVVLGYMRKGDRVARLRRKLERRLGVRVKLRRIEAVDAEVARFAQHVGRLIDHFCVENCRVEGDSKLPMRLELKRRARGAHIRLKRAYCGLWASLLVARLPGNDRRRDERRTN